MRHEMVRLAAGIDWRMLKHLTEGKWRIDATFKDDDAVTAVPIGGRMFGLDEVWVG